MVKIEGLVIDIATNVPLENANIRLASQDSIIITGTITNKNGKFELSGMTGESYLLEVSCLGYKQLSVLLKDISKSVNLGTLPIEEQSIDLNEIVVSANRIVTKVDRIVITPTDENIKISPTSVELLDHLMLPGLRVDAINRTITAATGGTIELRINGVKVTQSEIEALKPSDVIRVEYIDRPGVRYGGFDPPEGIIDFIVRRPESGFLFMTNLRNAFSTGFGDDIVSVKSNHRKSEFSLIYNISYREYKDRYTEKNEIYYFPSTDTLYRNSKGIPSPFGYQNHNLNLGYTFSDPKRYMFNIAVRNRFFERHNKEFSRLTDSRSPNIYNTENRQNSNQYLPAIDFYFMKYLRNNQKLEFNLVLNYLETKYERSSIEMLKTDTIDYNYTNVDGKQYSTTAEALYSKEFSNITLTSGIRQWNVWETNDYLVNNQTVKYNWSYTYLYTQASGISKNKKMNYRLGLAVVRDEGQSYIFYGFRPELDLKYSISNNLLIRYLLILSSNSPTKSYINTVRQNIDNLNAIEGNPDLSPYMSYFNRLNFVFTKKKLHASFDVGQAYHRHPVMEYTFFDDTSDKFISSLKNQNNLQLYTGNYFIKLGPFFNIATLSINGEYLHYISHGNDYSHVMRNFSIGAQIDLSYKNFSFSYRGNTLRKFFWGETTTFDENSSSVRMQYNNVPVTIGLGILYPFTNAWKAGSQSLSSLAPSERWSYIKDNGNMIILSFSWNVSVGRKFKSENQGLRNEGAWENILKFD
ncbi:MAG: hypothetical protein BGO34_02430 [Bacteroidia bacterium 44-10]|nr:MAG: hypothetical protein BGO34_02430 [Bacteroidia bacterium 44-10]